MPRSEECYDPVSTGSSGSEKGDHGWPIYKYSQQHFHDFARAEIVVDNEVILWPRCFPAISSAAIVQWCKSPVPFTYLWKCQSSQIPVTHLSTCVRLWDVKLKQHEAPFRTCLIGLPPWTRCPKTETWEWRSLSPAAFDYDSVCVLSKAMRKQVVTTNSIWELISIISIWFLLSSAQSFICFISSGAWSCLRKKTTNNHWTFIGENISLQNSCWKNKDQRMG